MIIDILAININNYYTILVNIGYMKEKFNKFKFNIRN